MKSLLERIWLGFDPKLDHQIFPTNILINQQRLRHKGVVMIRNDRYHCMAHIQYFYDMILRLQATIYNFTSLLINMCLTCYMGLSEGIIPHSIHCWLIILILQFQGITPFSNRTVSTYDFIFAWAPQNLTWSPLKSWILDLLKDSTTNKTCSSEIPQVVQWNHGLRTYCDKNFRGWIAGFKPFCQLIEIRSPGNPGF